MIKYMIFISALLIVSCAGPTPDTEIAAIKQVIEKETGSFLKVERQNWQDAWVHTPYAYWSYSDSTGTSFIEGWDAIDKSFDTYFKTQKGSRNIDVAHPQDDISVDREWKEFRIYGDGAFVQYAQRVKDNQIDRDETSQIRIMEKVDGKWRVAYVGIIAKYPSE